MDIKLVHGQNRVTILSFSPLTYANPLCHLDVGFMGSLGTFYSQEVNQWLKNNIDRFVPQFLISKLLKHAY